ncbi:GTPase HflX [Enterococcus timonensis]|uniref:GTPase HflX n=1 Tax=Enterococcus timonensis TaxID=1852364 RepID=UPI0008D95942|nr:GTPase HflX [Enterococcus timonensis]
MEEQEKVILVGVETAGQTDFLASMEELANLTQTANGQVVETLTQKRQNFDRKTLIGSGKLQELENMVEAHEADLVIFNQELSPRQGQYLSEQLGVKVIDRIQLILDIFALRAHSKEGKLQVELAQLNYLLPRLSGMGTSLSRLGAGIGTRGPGESKLESDRRHIRDKILQIKREVQEVGRKRQVARQKRLSGSTFRIGLLGYTNAGKSSILNLLTETNTYEEDQLFATLDPLTKRWRFPQGFEVTVTDTVGFIQDLPTQLIDAFQSTLEESAEMDLLLHVVDAASPTRLSQEETVLGLLKDLDLMEIPRLTVYNKADLLGDESFVPTLFPNCLISTRSENGREILTTAVKREMLEILEPYVVVIAANQGDKLARLKTETLIVQENFDEETERYQIKGFAKKNMPLIERNDASDDEKNAN